MVSPFLPLTMKKKEQEAIKNINQLEWTQTFNFWDLVWKCGYRFTLWKYACHNTLSAVISFLGCLSWLVYSKFKINSYFVIIFCCSCSVYWPNVTPMSNKYWVNVEPTLGKRWPNIGSTLVICNVRWPTDGSISEDDIFDIVPTLAQHVGPTLGRWAKLHWTNVICQRWSDVTDDVGPT